MKTEELEKIIANLQEKLRNVSRDAKRKRFDLRFQIIEAKRLLTALKAGR